MFLQCGYSNETNLRIVLSRTGMVPHFLAGLTNKWTFYGLWADTMSSLLGKLVIPVAFLLYLCSLKKFKWGATKAAAREWVLHWPLFLCSSQVTIGYSSIQFLPSHSFLSSSLDVESSPC